MVKVIWLLFGVAVIALSKARSEEDLGAKQSVEPDVNKNANNTTMTSRQVISKERDLQECKDYFAQKKKELKQDNSTIPKLEPGNVDPDSIKVSYVNQDVWLVNVTWNPPKENLTALENYVILYGSADRNNIFCDELPRNTSFFVIRENENVWTYNQDIYILVTALPRKTFWVTNSPLKLFSLTEIPEIDPIPATLSKDEKEKFDPSLVSIIVGALVGVIILGVLVAIYRRKKQTQLIEEFETINQVQATKPQNVDTFFASYLPENEKYSNEVATIAYKLGTMGYKVIFDQVDSVNMNAIGFNMWVDKQILESKKYIVFCTPGYVRLWQSLTTSALDHSLNNVYKNDLVRVRYEIKRISDMYSESCSTSRIICIKMDPKMSTKLLPPWMNHNMLLWPEQKDDVMRRLNDQAAMVMHV